MGNYQIADFIPRKPIAIKIRIICGYHAILVYDNKGHTRLFSLDEITWC